MDCLEQTKFENTCLQSENPEAAKVSGKSSYDQDGLFHSSCFIFIAAVLKSVVLVVHQIQQECL